MTSQRLIGSDLRVNGTSVMVQKKYKMKLSRLYMQIVDCRYFFNVGTLWFFTQISKVNYESVVSKYNML